MILTTQEQSPWNHVQQCCSLVHVPCLEHSFSIFRVAPESPGKFVRTQTLGPPPSRSRPPGPAGHVLLVQPVTSSWSSRSHPPGSTGHVLLVQQVMSSWFSRSCPLSAGHGLAWELTFLRSCWVMLMLETIFDPHWSSIRLGTQQICAGCRKGSVLHCVSANEEQRRLGALHCRISETQEESFFFF